jgi:hypothetical protein
MLWGNPTGERSKMESYLKEKYGKNFRVSNIRTEGAGLGVRGEIDGDASPVGDKSLTFKVQDMTGGLHDQYAAATWQEQEKPKLAAIASEFGNLVTASPEIYVLYFADGNIKGNFPTLDQLPDRANKGITYYIHLRNTDPYNPILNDKYVSILKAFTNYILDIKAPGNTSVGLIIPDRGGYHYGAGIEHSALSTSSSNKNALLDFSNNSTAKFEDYFKRIKN